MPNLTQANVIGKERTPQITLMRAILANVSKPERQPVCAPVWAATNNSKLATRNDAPNSGACRAPAASQVDEHQRTSARQNPEMHAKTEERVIIRPVAAGS